MGTPRNARLADHDWLHRRYSIDGARVTQIATEAGADRANVYRALRRHQIPLRGSTTQNRWVETLTPAILKPLLESGVSKPEIARRVGCPLTCLYDAIARHQLDPPTPVETDRLRDLYQTQGLSIPQVAVELGLQSSTARRHLLAAGIRLRRPGRRRKSQT